MVQCNKYTEHSAILTRPILCNPKYMGLQIQLSASDVPYRPSGTIAPSKPPTMTIINTVMCLCQVVSSTRVINIVSEPGICTHNFNIKIFMYLKFLVKSLAFHRRLATQTLWICEPKSDHSLLEVYIEPPCQGL